MDQRSARQGPIISDIQHPSRPEASVRPAATQKPLSPVAKPATAEALKPSVRRRWPLVVFTVVVAIIVATSAYLAYDSWQTNRQMAQAAHKSSTGNAANDQVDEKPVTRQQTDAYVVAADMPRLLTIPAIGVRARILSIDVANNQMGAPAKLDDTGWYVGSTKPGKPGLTFIDGHNQGWTRAGVFKKLGDLKPGQPITITMGNNTTYTYQITATKLAQLKDINMTKLLTPPDGTGSYLVLMSCGGPYDRQAGEYQAREIITAKLT